MIQGSAYKQSPARPMFSVGTFKRFRTLIAAVLAAARASRQKVDDAHAARCTLASFAKAEFEDTGVDPSDATGISPWQPNLPFFMQSGFGRK